MSQDNLLSKQDYALVALRQILRATELNSRALAKQSGLNPSQLILMNLIANKPGITPSEAARDMSISQATATVLAEKLSAKEYLERTKDLSDKRKFILSLTKKGEQALLQAPDMLQARFLNAFQHLETWEQSFLVAALEKTAKMLDASDYDAAPVLDIGTISTLP